MGLLLIALGVIMLVSQILEISFIEHIIKWWPIILILIGLEILLYIFLSNQDAPKVKFDVFSIIIISILMMASVGVYAVTGIMTSGDGVILVGPMFDSYKNESKYTRTFELDAVSTNLIIDNVVGNISIAKGDGDKIEVEANITIKNNDEEYAAEIADSLITVAKEKELKISSNSKEYSNKGKIGSIQIDYSVKVPDSVNVEVENKFGDVSLTDLAQSAKVNNKNGKITVESLGGDLIVNSSFGEVKVQDIKGKTQVYSKNGDVIANNCNKDITIESSFGDIRIDGVKGIVAITNSNGQTQGNWINGDINVISKFGDVTLTDVSGNADVDNANGEVSISNVGGYVKVSNGFGNTRVSNANKGLVLNNTNGDITVEANKVIMQDVNIKSKFGDILLKLPAPQNGYFEANTKFGDIENDFGLEVNENMSTSSMKGTLTDDKIKFILNSENGDIKLEKIER
ncbi:hypothetical protein Clocl_0615 [Acetivibrio clariflavus DSM 19732]|uniref:LiaF transmembrane domain-containing protein n=2 Tax=Acetivibrio clariflavus TaxID=288965 RepID=G8LTX8_ACECE|nr:hypothetical protein Clocl_0615 [Acetivibrio clariflavus DSM 19732]